MPPYKQADSLKHSCFLVIAKYVHDVSVDLEENAAPKYMDKMSLSRLASCLPAIFVEQVIVKVVESILRTVNRCRRTIGLKTCLETLLQPHVTKLDLSGLFFKMRLPSHINTSIRSVVCQNVCRMQNLSYINFASKCDDDVLLALSKYCKNILVIVISLSDLVTDKGIKYISDGCFLMETLEIYKCWGVSVNGIKYALENCSNLQKLHCDELGHVLLRYFRNSSKKFKLKNFEQTYVRSNFEPTYEEATWLGEACPEIESVRLSTEEDFLFSVPKLSQSLRIVELEVASISGNAFTQAIQQISSTLVKLNLSCESIHQENVMHVGKLCKNLTTFQLSTATIENDQMLNNNGEYFTQLHSLDLQVWKESFINSQLTDFFLLWCHHLTHIVIKARMDFFTDTYLKRIVQVNTFPHVNLMYISSDTFVPLTIRSVHLLLSTCSSLESLLISSWDVSEDEFLDLKVALKENNYNLNVV